MKISWGSKITFVYIAFVVFVVIAVLFAFRQDLNLVTDNYYEKELVYQNQIDKEKNAESLTEKPEINFNNKVLQIKFPKSFNYKEITGKIHLYRPADSKRDIVLPLGIDSTYYQLVGLEQVEKGLWKVKLDWNYHTLGYFKEFVIMVE